MGANHIVSLFDDELRYLENKVLFMGEHAIFMIQRAIQAVITKDSALAKQVIEDDVVLDNIERDIDEKAIAIIAKRQPMAVDLRQIIGTIRIATDLERIGDKGKNIAKRAAVINTTGQSKEFYAALEKFAQTALKQLQKVLDVYKTRAIDEIDAVVACDDEIDAMYNELFRELLAYMAKDPSNITACAHLLFCAKNLERVGDHATNVAEAVYYITTGNYLPLEEQKYDENFAL
ncbi:phosphate signaling complex protein PhoU [Bartonella sp. TP]|uniref:phosphate signaling complex protein PhoU n=1 Tax=Bartonella sp. TP TaxID=3057550 RepID=UPI0025B079C4|nr:phosphate signaling complex protein PhoU [Bartonella sp. TP]WJW80371.1 phosphate signaling complex protein PhoU [Bartonella sp. TP]